MWIQVDFYKSTGKWYAGGPVNIGNAKFWQKDVECSGPSDTKHYNTHQVGDEGTITMATKMCNPVAAAIAKNQDILIEGSITGSRYFVVVQNIASGTTIHKGIPGKEQIVNLAIEDNPDTPGNFCQGIFFHWDFPPGA